MIRDPKDGLGFLCGLFVGLAGTALVVRMPITSAFPAVVAAAIMSACAFAGVWVQFVVMSRRL